VVDPEGAAARLESLDLAAGDDRRPRLVQIVGVGLGDGPEVDNPGLGRVPARDAGRVGRLKPGTPLAMPRLCSSSSPGSSESSTATITLPHFS
jgi:hypothetical protein